MRIGETEWQMPWNSKPNDAALRQLLAYSHFYDAEKAFLVYPSKQIEPPIQGRFADSNYGNAISYDGAHGGVIRLNNIDEQNKLKLKVGFELIDMINSAE